MVSFFEIEMLGNLSDQYSRMARKASKKMQENMQIIAESELSDSMRTSIDSYFRARSDLQRQYASVGLMNHIKKYLINLENEEKESLKNGRG